VLSDDALCPTVPSIRHREYCHDLLVLVHTKQKPWYVYRIPQGHLVSIIVVSFSMICVVGLFQCFLS
jgi:hypothetical protein